MLSAFVLSKEYIKEKSINVIPNGYWNNKALIYKDKVENHIDSEEFMHNLHNGKYYLPELSDVKKAKKKFDPEYTVYISRGGWFGKKKYKELMPYKNISRYYKVYDKDWGKWLIVSEQDEGMCKISGCKYKYVGDEEWLNL